MSRSQLNKKERKLLLLFVGLFGCAAIFGIASLIVIEHKILLRICSALLMLVCAGVGIAAKKLSVVWFTLYALIYLNLDLPPLSVLADFKIPIWFTGNIGTAFLVIYDYNKAKEKNKDKT